MIDSLKDFLDGALFLCLVVSMAIPDYAGISVIAVIVWLLLRVPDKDDFR